MEIIIGAIQVGGHHSDIVGSVLQVVTFAHLQACYFRNGIFLVGIFQRRRQQTILRHRLRCILGIDTGRAQKQQSLHAVLIGLANHVALHHHVLHDEVSTIQAVGHDSTHKGSCQHHRIRLLLIKELAYGHLVCQIQFLVTSAHQVCITSLQQVIPNSGAHKSVMPRYIYFHEPWRQHRRQQP